MDPVPAVGEEWVNHWLEHELGNAEIIKTETTGVLARGGDAMVREFGARNLAP